MVIPSVASSAAKSNRLPIWSNGLGTQSTALAILIAQGKLPRPVMAITADTGREHDDSFSYAEELTFPLLRSLDIQIEVARHDLATVDLYGKNGDILIPAYTTGGQVNCRPCAVTSGNGASVCATCVGWAMALIVPLRCGWASRVTRPTA